jgi:hypothetical protein
VVERQQPEGEILYYDFVEQTALSEELVADVGFFGGEDQVVQDLLLLVGHVQVEERLHGFLGGWHHYHYLAEVRADRPDVEHAQPALLDHPVIKEQLFVDEGQRDLDGGVEH